MKPFIVGTAAYGPFDYDKSDIDIVVRNSDLITLDNTILEIKKIELSWLYKNQTILVNFLGRNFQLILAPDEELENWKYMTEEMRKLGPIDNRDERIDAASNLRGYYDYVLSKKS